MKSSIASLALLVALPALADDTKPIDHASGTPTKKVVGTMTRGVFRFGQLEQALGEAMRRRDRDALDPMLAQGFEMRLASRPGDPVPRELWLSAIAASGAAETTNDQMAVHDLGERALVSFRATPEGGAPQFVVDLWTHEGESWRLAVRYAGGVGDDRGVTGNVPTGALQKRGD